MDTTEPIDDSLEVNTLREPLEVEPLEVESLGETPGGLPLIARGTPSRKHPLGKVIFDKKGLLQFQSKPLESKREILRQQWAGLAYILLSKAIAFSQSAAKKDYGRLVQLATSAGISYDKVFPKLENPGMGSLVVNLFKGLPSEKVLAVLGDAPSPKGEYLDGVS